MFRKLLVGSAIVLLIGTKSAAEPVFYNIDPSQSSLLAFGTLSGNTPTFQTPGSNLTTYTGVIAANRTATSIQFTFGSGFIDADQQPSKQQPGYDGEAGSAFADYGLRAPNTFGTTYAAFRDLVFDLTSDPLPVAANGNFDGTFDIIFASGSVDWNTGAQWANKDFSFRFSSNQSPNTPSVVVANGIETLTLPMRLSTIFSTQNTNDSTLRLSGTIVAWREVGDNRPQWIKDGGGSWNVSANWDGGIPNGGSATANFLGALTAPNSPAIVTLDGDHTIGTLVFDNPNTYEIAQGTSGLLSVGDASTPGTITVQAGHHHISAPLILASNTTARIAISLSIDGNFTIADNQSLTTTGSGMLTISGFQNHGQGATLNVTAGELLLNSNAGHPGGGPVAPHATLTIHLNNEFSLITLNADQDLQALRVDFQDPESQSFDLNSPDDAGAFRSVRIYDTTDASKQSLYAAMINAHSNPGDGIFDAGLDSHPSSALGLALFNDPRGSQYLLIRPTRIGDLNLDGIVSISDFIDLAANFNASGTNITWQEGDLNGDNAVTISDFIDLAANFGSNYAGGTMPISDSDLATLTAFATAHGVSLAPEPTILPLLCLLTPLIRRRRRD